MCVCQPYAEHLACTFLESYNIEDIYDYCPHLQIGESRLKGVKWFTEGQTSGKCWNQNFNPLGSVSRAQVLT